MLELIKKGIGLAGGAIRGAKIVQAKAKALTDDLDLDGKSEMQEIKEMLPVIKADAVALFEKVKACALLAWGLAMHVAEAGEEKKDAS